VVVVQVQKSGPPTKKLCIVLALVCATGATGQATESGGQRGKALLETMCARCHAVGKTGRSPHPDAPAFRSFGDDKLYDNDFAQRLQDGLSAMHPDMPTFHFSREDADAAVNYLRSIQEHGEPRR
jgi:mono/diheme cytochrome c family protein